MNLAPAVSAAGVLPGNGIAGAARVQCLVDFCNRLDDKEVFAFISTAMISRPLLAPSVIEYAVPDLTFASARALKEKRCTGVIKSFSNNNGFGFIECPELKAVFGHDVFLHRNQLGPFRTKESVSFATLLNKDGLPQAYDLCRLDGLPPPTLEEWRMTTGIGGRSQSTGMRGTMESIPLNTSADIGSTAIINPSTGAVGGISPCIAEPGSFSAAMGFIGPGIGAPNGIGSGIGPGLDVLGSKGLGTNLGMGAPNSMTSGMGPGIGAPTGIGLDMGPDTGAPGSMNYGMGMAHSIGPVIGVPGSIGFGAVDYTGRHAGASMIPQQDLMGMNSMIGINGARGPTDLYGGSRPPRPGAGVVVPPPPGMGQGGIMSSRAPRPGSEERHVGCVKSFNHDKGYGFIDCPAVQQNCGRDVFIRRENILEFQAGDMVSFMLVFNKEGQPQAQDLQADGPPTKVMRMQG